MYEGIFFSLSLPTFVIFDDNHSDRREVILHCVCGFFFIEVLICISLMVNNVEHHFMCLLAISMSSLEKNVSSGLSAHF